MTTFDIFQSSGNKNDDLWLECIEGLDAATERMYEIATHRPGIYFVLNLRDHLVAAKTDTRSLASGTDVAPDDFGGRVARVFKFIDILGCELHTINDPEDKLPIPAIRQVISIGPSRMRVESVTLSSINPTVYTVRVRSVPTIR